MAAAATLWAARSEANFRSGSVSVSNWVPAAEGSFLQGLLKEQNVAARWRALAGVSLWWGRGIGWEGPAGGERGWNLPRQKKSIS